jgi:hypothetical protein
MNVEDLINIEDAARQLGNTRRAVEIAMQRGKLAYVEVFGRRVILRSELEAYKQRNKLGRPRKRPEDAQVGRETMRDDA